MVISNTLRPIAVPQWEYPTSSSQSQSLDGNIQNHPANRSPSMRITSSPPQWHTPAGLLRLRSRCHRRSRWSAPTPRLLGGGFMVRGGGFMIGGGGFMVRGGGFIAHTCRPTPTAKPVPSEKPMVCSNALPSRRWIHGQRGWIHGQRGWIHRTHLRAYSGCEAGAIGEADGLLQRLALSEVDSWSEGVDS
jgi:hypothetical protein